MKQTKMTHEELIAMVMADYTAKINAEEAQREAIRQQPPSDFPSWGPALGQWGHWNISDRD